MDEDKQNPIQEPVPNISGSIQPTVITPGEVTMPVNPTPLQTQKSPAVSPIPERSNIPSTEVPTSTRAFLTGSQLEEVKPQLPKGVYVLAGVNFLGFIGKLFDTSQIGNLVTIAMLVSLLLAIGLLLRLEIARKLMVWLMGILLVLSVACIFVLMNLQNKLQGIRTQYDNAISRIDQHRLTATQKDNLASLEASISDSQKEAGKAIGYSYTVMGFGILESIIVIAYLTRPKVKEAFEDLK